MQQICVQQQLLSLERPVVMGILNCTPDSFYDGGKYTKYQKAIDSALKMYNDGATMVDIGGYSTRPGADEVSITEEADRILGIIEGIKKQRPESIISVDTFRAGVAHQAIEAGADIINDVSIMIH